MSIGSAAATAAIIAGTAGVASAGIGAASAGAARGAQENAQNQSIAEQKRQFDIAQSFLQKQYADSKPFRDLQLNAQQQLAALSDPNSTLANQQRQVGTDAIQKQLAAQGLLRSTAQGDQLSNLEVGLAGNRANLLNALAGNGGANLLQNIGTNQASLAATQGQQIGSSLANIGNINANSALQTGQAISGGLAGINNSFQSYRGGVQQQEQFDKIMNLLGGKAVAPGGGR